MWNSRPPPFMAKTILNFHFDYLNPSLSRIKRSQVMSMAKGGRKDIILLDSNGDNDAEDVADADYFADEAADVSGKSSLSQ